MPPLKRPASSHKIPNWVQRIWNGFRRSGAVNFRRLTSTSSYDGIAGDARNDFNAADLGEHSHEFISFWLSGASIIRCRVCCDSAPTVAWMLMPNLLALSPWRWERSIFPISGSPAGHESGPCLAMTMKSGILAPLNFVIPRSYRSTGTPAPRKTFNYKSLREKHTRRF